MAAAFVTSRRAGPALGTCISGQTADSRSCLGAPIPGSGAGERPGFFARIRQVLARARTREAERRVALYIQAHGGRFTDQMERRILDELTGTDRGGFRF